MLKNWVVKSSTGSHFDFLDGLRGLAILMVVFYHTIYFNPQSGSFVQTIGRFIGAGWMGVPVFFVLSGFLISYPMFLRSFQNKTPASLREYALRRVAKIIPPFYLSLVVFAIWYSCLNHVPGAAMTALRWAFGIPNLALERTEFNGVYWSLIVEVQFYILLPVLFAVLGRLKYRLLGPFIFTVMLVVPWLARCLNWQPGLSTSELNFLMARFPCKLDYFSWGVFFAWLHAGNLFAQRTRERIAVLGIVGVCLLLALMMAWAHLLRTQQIQDHPTFCYTNLFELGLGLAGFLMLFLIYDPSQWLTRILCLPWLRFTGIVSYEWFLFHQPVVQGFHDLIGKTSGNVALYLLVVFAPLALTYCFSVLLYQHFSLPIMQRLRGKTGQQKLAAPI